MSTRATYQFKAEHKPTVTLYVHHDGYPTGASSYFYDTLIAEHSGVLAEQFLRAVPRSEITGSHDSHWDTAFRYTVTGNGPGATMGAETSAGMSIYSGSLAGFLDKNRPAFGVGGEKYHPFRPVDLPHSKFPTWLTLPLALAEIEEKETPDGGMRSSNLATLRIWKKNGVCGPGSGNFKSVSSRVHAIATAFELTDALAELRSLSLRPSTHPTK